MSKPKQSDETLTPDLSEDRLKRIRSNGWIKLPDLICVVAEDERWTEELPRLYEKHCKPKKLKFETTAQRFTAWQEIFRCEELRNIPEDLHKLEEFISKELELPLPQCLTVDKADEEKAGFVFDELNRLDEEYDPEKLKELEPIYVSEHQYKQETLKAYNKELEALFKKPAEPHPEKPNKELLPCEPSTRWEQITMTEVPSEIEDEEPMFRVKTPEGEKLYTFSLLRMHHKQKPNRPLTRWALLKLFAQNHGFITGIQHNSLLSDHKRLLDKHLQEIFGINESIYEGHAKKLRGHKTRITFRSEVYRSICESTADRRNPEDY